MADSKKQIARPVNSMINSYLSPTMIVLRALRLRQKILLVNNHNKHLMNKVDPEIEKKHIKYWKQLFINVTPYWLRYYSNMSKNVNYKYIPEDVFYTVVERKLNDINMAISVSDKSNYEILYHGILFPYSYLKNVSGTYLNSKHEIINEKEARKIFTAIDENIIVKPSIETGGGLNVSMLKHVNGKHVGDNSKTVTFDDLVSMYKKDFLIQRVIKQHPFYAQFNQSSVNTIRMFTYRSIKDETIHVLSALIRMGMNGSVCDNISAGGISVGVNIKDGSLHKYALNHDTGNVYYCHPHSKIAFDGLVAYGIEKAVSLARKVSAMIPSQRILSHDIAITEEGSAMIIEINTREMGINFLQLMGWPLFAEFTDEVVEYSKIHKDDFQYFRAKH